MNQQQEKPTGFDAYAGDYAALIRDPIRERFAASSRFFFERKLDVIRRFYRRFGVETRNLRWLDAGCGQGDMLRVGKPYFKHSIGCDPSQGMLESCSDLEVKHQLSLDRLPFENKSFDFITAVCVYHHIPEDRRASFTAEAVRVLKPGGVFCVIEHNPLNPVTRRIVSRTPVDADARLLSVRETRKLMASASMKVLETRYFLFFPERVHRLAASIEGRLGWVPLGGQYSVFARTKCD